MPYIRVRERNQLTLPKEVSTALQVKEGDFLEVWTHGNAVVLRPTRIVPFGSPEGEAEHQRAVQDFQEGRYKRFDSIEGFAEFLRSSPAVPDREEPRDVHVKHSPSELEQLVGSVTRLVAKAMHETHGDPAAAAEALERTQERQESKSESKSLPVQGH
jgi:AbrB family looped-hinge helix DNA binding protein